MGTKYQVDGDDLTAIANKIRSKGGTSASLEFPDGFKDAVDAIQTGITPTGTKNISTNGTHDVTNYASANVAVPASAVDSGTKNINSNGTHDVVGYASAAVNVQNSYSQSDEGKVVQSGALVSQSSQTIDTNGTYDTTTKNEVVVDVQSGGGGVGTLVTVATAKSLVKESINELFSGFAPLSTDWYLVGMLTNKAVADYVDYQLLTFFYRANSSSWGCFARYRTEGSSIGYNHQTQIGNTSRGSIAVGDTYQIFAPEYLG